MPDTELRIESWGGDDESEADDGPMPLMLEDETPVSLPSSGNRLDASEYPEICARVSVTDDGPVGGLTRGDFSVTERPDSEPTDRELLDCEPVGGAGLDLVVVFDDTASMGDEIADAKAGVTDVTEAIDAQGIDARYALVTFKDDVELDLGFTRDADELKDAVNGLRAKGGGDAPENNVDAIERGLALPFRDDAEQVILDVTDARTHYRGDGDGYSDHTLSEVADDLNDSGATFVAVSRDRENEKDSIKTLAGEVGGFWTDIDDARFGAVLDRITELLAGTYELRFHTCTPPGTERPVRITVDTTARGPASDEAPLSVPGRFDLPPECEEGGDFVDTRTGDLDRKGGGSDVVDHTEKELVVTTNKDHIDTEEPVLVTVYDEEREPVSDAVVEAGGKEARTDERGTCRLQFDEPGDKTVEARLPDDPDYEPAQALGPIHVR